MHDELPLAAASRRLRELAGKGGRPRKNARSDPAPSTDSRDDSAMTPARTPTKTGAATRAGAPRASALPSRRLLDVRSAALYLGVSSWTLRDLVNAGRLPRIRLPLADDKECRRLLVDVHDLDRLIESAKETPGR